MQPKNVNVNISIAEPCNRSWEEMTPVEHGRSCAYCTKTVVDFTRMSDVEVLNHIHRNGLGCGRFYADQLGRVIQPPFVRPKYPGLRKWILSFLLAAGWLKDGAAQTRAGNQDTIVAASLFEKAPRITTVLDSIKQEMLRSVKNNELRANTHRRVIMGDTILLSPTTRKGQPARPDADSGRRSRK